jgi:hypothetical protein
LNCLDQANTAPCRGAAKNRKNCGDAKMPGTAENTVRAGAHLIRRAAPAVPFNLASPVRFAVKCGAEDAHGDTAGFCGETAGL